jgi:hypothetical protein
MFPVRISHIHDLTGFLALFSNLHITSILYHRRQYVRPKTGRYGTWWRKHPVRIIYTRQLVPADALRRYESIREFTVTPAKQTGQLGGEPYSYSEYSPGFYIN